MEICVNDIDKIIEIWISDSDKSAKDIKNSLAAIYSETSKYKVAVFESGNGNLYENTKNLLLHNRKIS
jgi:hypothetical protein